jgi:hypothetical protein
LNIFGACGFTNGSNQHISCPALCSMSTISSRPFEALDYLSGCLLVPQLLDLQLLALNLALLLL